MNWFLVKLVFRIFCGNGNHAAQFEEQLRLICAEDELHAFHKARLLGEGDHCRESAGDTINVKWKFIDVTELHCLDKFSDGAEISSLVKEEASPELYIRTTKRMATQLLQRSLHQFTDINHSFIGA